MSDTRITRAIVADMRAIARCEPLAWLHYGYDVKVRLDRCYGRRRYILEYVSPLHAGILAIYDATDETLYLRNQLRPYYDSYPLQLWARIASRTRYLDALLEIAPLLDPYSETLESLAQWRAAPHTVVDYDHKRHLPND